MSARGIRGKKRPGAGQPVRLTDEYIGERRRSPPWVGLNVAAALAIDEAIAALGIARPLLLVSGFWRSGTTWLQECLAEGLGAKTVFEPLAPMTPERRAMLDGAFLTEDALQAFVPGPEHDPAFWAFLEATFSGRRGSRYALGCRRRLSESLRAGIVVKDVRLHRNLGRVHQRLGVPVVHIRRHPCAVVASLRAAQWHWSFDRLSLLAFRLPPVDAELLRAFDRDAVSRLAAFWAIHEQQAAADLRDQPWADEVTYERMAQDPHALMAAVCAKLGLRLVRHAGADRPAASIDPGAFEAATTRRPDFWRELLTDAEVGDIERVATALYPEWRRHWDG